MKMPKLLYKYSTINEDIKKSLRESYIWFAQKDTLNDPFDLQYQLTDRFQLEILKEFIESPEYLSQLKGGIFASVIRHKFESDTEFRVKEINIIFQKIQGQFHISCFTGVEDNLLMWSYYAGKHTGICLIYDLNKFSDICFPVNYSQDYPIHDCYEDLNKKGFSTKSKHWEHEEEWRLVSKEKGKVVIPMEWLKGIIFGCMTTKNDKEDILNICKESGYKNLVFFDMSKSDYEYKLIKARFTPT